MCKVIQSIARHANGKELYHITFGLELFFIVGDEFYYTVKKMACIYFKPIVEKRRYKNEKKKL